jgi:hypothetical protein
MTGGALFDLGHSRPSIFFSTPPHSNFLTARKDFFAITFSSLRASVDPEAVKGYAFKYSEIPGEDRGSIASTLEFKLCYACGT